MIDRTTRWAEAAAIPDATSDAVLQALVSTWIVRFGIPKVVTTDRGRSSPLGLGPARSQSWESLPQRLQRTIRRQRH